MFTFPDFSINRTPQLRSCNPNFAMCESQTKQASKLLGQQVGCEKYAF